MHSTATRLPHPDQPIADRLAVFSTKLGWMAVAWSGKLVLALTLGHHREHFAIDLLMRGIQLDPRAGQSRGTRDDLVRRLKDYSLGAADEFRDVQVLLSPVTPFQRRVVQGCRAIPYGRTLSYAALAAQAGSPGAARAVGNIMARNRFPLIIPCHRVVGSKGSLGGYSASGGLRTKRQLLDLEACHRSSS
jgi:methylated-DNA-[protein]-cysteine S-methyltransferase